MSQKGAKCYFNTQITRQLSCAADCERAPQSKNKHRRQDRKVIRRNFDMFYIIV